MGNYGKMLFAALAFLFVVGCAGKEEEGGAKIYYLNTEGSALTAERYDWKSEEAASQVEEALERLRKPEDTVECTSAIPADVLVEGVELSENRLELSFSKEYALLEKPAEVLLRAAVVKSLTQIEGVYLVRFHVEGEPLKDSRGEAIGYMRGEDFVQNPCMRQN